MPKRIDLRSEGFIMHSHYVLFIILELYTPRWDGYIYCVLSWESRGCNNEFDWRPYFIEIFFYCYNTRMGHIKVPFTAQRPSGYHPNGPLSSLRRPLPVWWTPLAGNIPTHLIFETRGPCRHSPDAWMKKCYARDFMAHRGLQDNFSQRKSKTN